MHQKITRRELTTSQLSADIPQILRQIYSSRGIQSDADLDRDLKDLLPYHSLTDIEKAAKVLTQAIAEQKRLLILGDFDADGATSSALMVSALKMFGAHHVEYLVPNRFDYGYGLTPEIVEVAAKWEPDLIITVDNGISSIQGVNTAKEKGIDVLITDHHLPGSELPDAVAIVNPNQPNDIFPSKNLAGVGVAFYVMLALRRSLLDADWFAQQNIAEPNMGHLLDLVALGTVADVVVLDKNNRILVHQGLRRIRAGKCRAGIIALLEIAKRKREKLVASDLGFAIGPRLNAAGRLDDMALGIECLLCEDPQKAQDIAKQLDSLNHERREIEAEMREQAIRELNKLQLDKKELPIGLCLFDDQWHQGVIGILAGRIKERLHRPVIAFAKTSDTEIKGSARSVNGIHIRDILDSIASQNPDLISKFGGHAMAAGLSLEISKFNQFSDAFDAEVSKHLRQQDLIGEIVSDGALQTSDFSLKLAQLLRDGGPWGQYFPEPIFDGRFNIINQRIVGTNHLKLTLEPEDTSLAIDAIAFNVSENEWPNHRCNTIVAAYRLDINEYKGNTRLQLMIEHLEPVE